MSERAAGRGRLVAVVGPTAAGKTELALRIAEAAGAEIVSLDSQQVYRGMDIGTGKASAAERARVPHHLLDVASPDEPMTAARFAELADRAITDARARGRTVVLAGGTGLYYRALVYGLFDGPPADAALRAQLLAEDLGGLRARLEIVDPVAATRIDPHDRVRTVRALEVHTLTGRPISDHQRDHDHRRVAPRYEVRGIGLALPREELGQRIDARIDAMFAAGLVGEVQRLVAAHGTEVRALTAIGYRELVQHLAGTLTLPDAVTQMRQATKRYARRQLGWFRSEPTVAWYKDAREVDLPALAAWLREDLPEP